LGLVCRGGMRRLDDDVLLAAWVVPRRIALRAFARLRAARWAV